MERAISIDTCKPHGLARNPIKACVVPKSVGWISSVSVAGTVDLAPFSFFNLMAIDIAKLQPIARLGYTDDAVVRDTFRMLRPSYADQLKQQSG